jgi:hypothetical protein
MGQPAEAATVIDEGFAAGTLGTGPNAAAHQSLRDQARKLAARDTSDHAAAEAAARKAADGNSLVNLGWAMVAGLPAAPAAPASAAEPGLALIDQGLAKGGLRRPVEARLHMGIAQLKAGRKDAARVTLAEVAQQAATAGDSLAEPARLWALWASAPPMLPKAN